MNNLREPQKYRIVIKLSTLALALIVILAFFYHFFLYTFSGVFFLITLTFLTIVFVVSKPIKVRMDRLNIYWLLSAVCILISYLRTERSSGSTLDVVVILLGIVLVICFSGSVNDYNRVCKMIPRLSLFYAFGVLLQIAVPSAYNAILSYFPTSLENAIRSGAGEVAHGARGFTVNTGFAAGFIAAGIMVLLSESDNLKNLRKTSIVKLVILVFALLFTGKRGTTAFLFLTIIVCYLIPTKGMEKIKRYWKFFFMAIVIVILFIVFGDMLGSIPIVGRIIDTIEGVLAGEDVTSKRSNLFRWAMELVYENPGMGIGWGNYRTTVVGNATKVVTLDAHNIYLQLLCENGIIGAACIIATFIVFWIASKNAYCDSIKRSEREIQDWQPVLFFSFMYQTFFLLYGLSGNPLYDQHYQILYFFSCSILIAYRYICRYKCNISKK